MEETTKDPKPSKLDLKALLTKKWLGVVIAGLLVVGGVTAAVVTATHTKDQGPTPVQTVHVGTGAPTVVPTTVPPVDFIPDETETPTPTPTATPTPSPVERVPAGQPGNRGPLPAELPLPDSYTYIGEAQEGTRTVIQGSVSDSKEAITVLDHNLAINYIVDHRKLNGDKTSGLYRVEGPGLPRGTEIFVEANGSFKVSIPKP